MTVGPVMAELVERREILPDQRILTWHAPAVARGARAGQLVQLLVVDDDGLLVRWAAPINTVDLVTGVVSVHLDLSRLRLPALGRLRVGDQLGLAGPLGRPFELDARSRHLLLVAMGPSIAALRLLIDEALVDGRQVTLLFGAEGAWAVYPSTLLPDEVEYVVATDDGSLGHRGSVVDLVPTFEAWADQSFASGPPALLAQLASLSASRRARLGVARLGRKRGGGRADAPGSTAARRKAYLQISVAPLLSCAGATCLGCAVAGSGGGLLRTCREGPVFAADELSWERDG